MRSIFVFFLLVSLHAFPQWKDYKIASTGDTLNRIDKNNLKQAEWVIRYESVRGEPGYEEEGVFKDGRKEGEWRLFSLMGDLVGIENYKWGNKDGICRYFGKNGELILEQGWKALNPDRLYDTIDVEDLDKLDSYTTVIVKNEGIALKHGPWKYYNSETGALLKTEMYSLGKLAVDKSSSVSANPSEKKTIAKPKEVLDFEKKNSGKKKVKYKDGSTGGL